MSGDGTLRRLADAGWAHGIGLELFGDPDPAPHHPYQPDPQSGAGNCLCGAAERHRRHPHDFLAGESRPDLCTCALPPEARCHTMTTPARVADEER